MPGAGERLIGQSYIAVLPETSQFRPDADAGIRRALTGIDPQVPIGANTTPLLAQFEAAKREILKGRDIEMLVSASTIGAQRSILELMAEAQALKGQLRDIPITTDDDASLVSMRKMDAVIDGLVTKLREMHTAGEEDPDVLLAVDTALRSTGLSVDALAAKFIHLGDDFDPEKAVKGLAAMRVQVLDISAGLKDMKLDPDDYAGQAKLSRFRSQVKSLTDRLLSMRADMDTTAVRAELDGLIAKTRAWQKSLAGGANVGPDVSEVSTFSTLSAADAQVVRLISDVGKMRDEFVRAGQEVPPSLLPIDMGLQHLGRRIESLAGVDLGPDVLAEVAAIRSAIGPLEAEFGKLGSATSKAGDAASESGNAAATSSRGWFSLAGVVGNLGKIHIPLFASALSRADKSAATLNNGIVSLVPGMKGLNNSFLFTASGAHLVIEAAIELAAVWGPALIGMTAFGIAAYPIAKSIAVQWQNMKTVVDATGDSLKSQATGLTDMKSGVSGVEAAIKPEVLQLWGDFLTLKGSSHFTDVLKSIGGVLDDFGAKLTLVLNGNGSQKFLSKASSDIQGIGDGFEQVGRILGTLMQDVPGYAALLLKLGDAGLTGLADLVQAASPATAIFLKFHGALFYLGLAGTVLLTFGKNAVTAFRAVALGGAAVQATGGFLGKWGAALGSAAGGMVKLGKSAAIFAASLVGLRGAEAATTAQTAAMSTVMDALPWVAAAAAATAAGVVIYEAFKHSKDGAQQLNEQMEKTIQSSSMANVQSNIANAAKQTMDAMAQQKAVISSLDDTIQSHHRHNEVLQSDADDQKRQYAENSKALQQYASQSVTAANRTNSLSAAYGGAASAMNLMTLANVNQGDLATASASKWALDEQKIKATAAAYGFMGEQAGAVGAQLDALNISTGTTAQAVQNLASAESNWLSIITGGDTAFTSFEQGQSELATTLAKGSDAAADITVKIGNLSEKYSSAGAAMKGTSQAALAARQAFDSQISAAGTLYGNLQMLTAASGNTKTAQNELRSAGMDMVKQLLSVAGGSKEATTEVYALAQLVGYRGKDSFQALAKWVGNTKNAESDLDTEQGKLTASSATLSSAAKNLANTLANDVTESQSQAILSGDKFNSIQDALVKTLEKTKGHLSDNAAMLAGQYYKSLIAAGMSTSQAAQYTDALLTKLHLTPAAIGKVNSALGTLQGSAGGAAGELHDIDGELTNLTNRNWVVKVAYAVSGSSYLTSPPKGILAPGHAAGAYIVRGSGPSGQDSSPAMLAPGELVIPASHAPAFRDAAKRAGVPGMASGGMASGTPASPFTSASQSLSSLLTGGLYGFGENALNPLLNPAEAAVTGPTASPMTQSQGMQLIQLVQALVKLAQQSPKAIGQAVNSASGNGARKAFFG